MTGAMLQLPAELKRRLQGQLKDTFIRFQAALNDPAPVSIRMNPGKPISHIGDSEAIPWSEEGRYLSSRPRFTDDPLFHAGTYYVQEASSMFLEYMLRNIIDLSANHRVLDLSAAPGGKSTHLQALLTRDSLLVANEVIGSRNKILRQNLSRWGGDNHIVTQSDPKFFNKLPSFFDLILVDAPCSGEGLMRKDPHAIQEWSQSNVQLCARRQKRILADVLPALAEGGVLIYSTCTFSEAENEENLEWLEQESGLEPIKLNIPSEWGVVQTGPIGAGYRFYPHLTLGEGFFITALRKPGSAHKHKTAKKKNARIPATDTTEDRNWLKETERYAFINREEHHSAIPRVLYADYLSVQRALRITSAGLYMGKMYHHKLKPSPEMALSQALKQEIPRIEFSQDEALNFLAHIEIPKNKDYPEGYVLIVYQGHGLGWLHVLRNGQIRNKYPTAWRILQRHPKD